MRQVLLVIVVIGLLSGCDWVKMTPAAARVLPMGPPQMGCRDLGEIEVSVQNHVGPYDRNTVAVRDELETLARKEASSLRGDSVQPEAEPADGRQRWFAYRCRGK
jgi:hypothetical protein